MSAQARDVFEQLRGHHLRALNTDARRMALRRLPGQSVADIAERDARFEGAIRHEIERLQDAIFIPLALTRDQWATAFWVTAHLECCFGAA